MRRYFFAIEDVTKNGKVARDVSVLLKLRRYVVFRKIPALLNTRRNELEIVPKVGMLRCQLLSVAIGNITELHIALRELGFFAVISFFNILLHR
jgi:hypothetical protein